MARTHVSHAEIAEFADEKVNLKRDDATELRRQANMLRDRLESYLAEHPDFELRKMLLSGSLAKGTALKSISDIDVACYISCDAAPHKVSELIPWLASKLEKAFPNFKPEQVTRKTYSVGVKFMTTGNEVDIVPILYSGDPEWRGSTSPSRRLPFQSCCLLNYDFEGVCQQLGHFPNSPAPPSRKA